MASEADLKKKGRGSYDEKVAVIDEVQVTYVRWYDNKSVNLLSTLVGAEPVSLVTRWNRKENKYCQIPSPKLVQEYNKHMGGVDLMDSLIGLYRCRIRSKKWYHRLWFHLLDLTVVNAWLLYKRHLSESNSTRCKPMRLQEFKASVAQALCKQGEEETKKRGRPSADQEGETPAKRRKSNTVVPSSDVRLDSVGNCPQCGSKQ